MTLNVNRVCKSLFRAIYLIKISTFFHQQAYIYLLVHRCRSCIRLPGRPGHAGHRGGRSHALCQSTRGQCSTTGSQHCRICQESAQQINDHRNQTTNINDHQNVAATILTTGVIFDSLAILDHHVIA